MQVRSSAEKGSPAMTEGNCDTDFGGKKKRETFLGRHGKKMLGREDFRFPFGADLSYNM